MTKTISGEEALRAIVTREGDMMELGDLLAKYAALIASQAARIRELEEGLEAILDSAVLIANGKDEVVSRDALDRARSLSRKGGE